jgi:ribonuclease P protein component
MRGRRCHAWSRIDSRRVTRSNVRLFRRSPGASRAPATQELASIGFHDETYVSAFESQARPHARVSRTDENGRGPQGSGGSPRQGPRAPHRLTPVAPATRGSVRYRLRGTGAFESLFELGVRHDAHFLQLIAAPAAQDPGRVGYVIGRKAMPRAVDRNRLRRRLRESVRASRPSIERFDIILRVRQRVRAADIASAVAESRRLLDQLIGTQS